MNSVKMAFYKDVFEPLHSVVWAPGTRAGAHAVHLVCVAVRVAPKLVAVLIHPRGHWGGGHILREVAGNFSIPYY